MATGERNLLVLTCRGDDRAARELWSAFAGRLLAYAGAIVPSAKEDVVQRVFCRVLEHPERELAAVRDPLAWLVTQTRREALNVLRAERRERARRSRADLAGPREAGTAPVDVGAAVEGLPRPLREVIVLRHTTGMSFDAISGATGVNRNTVAWRYNRGLELLRQLLGGVDRSEVCRV